MRRSLIAIATCLAAALVIPAVAFGTLSEIGLTPTQQAQTTPTWPAPACPGSPCLAINRTTGFQVKNGAANNLFIVPRDGTIVAWSITMSSPTKAQTTFFNGKEGGPAEAGIAILRSGPHLTYRLLAASPYEQLEPYFGKTAQFPLAQTIPVKKGNIIALTVPTWAPALAIGFGNDTSWRSSRPKDKCDPNLTGTPHTTVQTVAKYQCLYRTARLTYSATLISTP